MSYIEVIAQKQHIKDFLKGLTRPEKLIVVLYYYEELTMREIAEVLELPESVILQRYSSVIGCCRSYLQKQKPYMN